MIRNEVTGVDNDAIGEAFDMQVEDVLDQIVGQERPACEASQCGLIAERGTTSHQEEITGQPAGWGINGEVDESRYPSHTTVIDDIFVVSCAKRHCQGRETAVEIVTSRLENLSGLAQNALEASDAVELAPPSVEEKKLAARVAGMKKDRQDDRDRRKAAALEDLRRRVLGGAALVD